MKSAQAGSVSNSTCCASIIIEDMFVNKSLILGIVTGAIAAVIVVTVQQGLQRLINPVHKIQEYPLEKYAFPILRQTNFTKGEISIGNVVQKDPNVRTYTFYFFDGAKKVSGLLNAPKEAGTYPVLVMFRGYVDKEIYQPGVGTQHAAEFFAKNGFITLAPDFLGYGSSDRMSNDSLESRFQTYTTGLSLMESIYNLDKALSSMNPNLKADTKKIAIWGHSNGGQIALSVVEISGKNYPTVMWAPVTIPFPESILYFADEMNDRGAYLRSVVADFVQKYNARLYSPPQYIKWLKAPIQLHQGSADEAVPQEWSDNFAKSMEKHKKDITYFIYSGEDHNFSQGSWTTLVSRDLRFYRKRLNL